MFSTGHLGCPAAHGQFNQISDVFSKELKSLHLCGTGMKISFRNVALCANDLWTHLQTLQHIQNHFSPPVRWGLLDFMSVSSPPSRPSPPSSSSSSCRPPQLRSCEFSVACRTTTAIRWVQCGVLDPNRDPMSSVWRAGPQPRCCEVSVACWTPTAVLRVQCGVLDPTCDFASSVWRAGPQR